MVEWMDKREPWHLAGRLGRPNVCIVGPRRRKRGAFASRELNGIQGCLQLQESGRCPRATAAYHRPLSSQGPRDSLP
jgi:hypothetical protein